MSEVTLATLAMEVSVPAADAAIDKLKKLRAAASELEGQAGKTATASKEQASAHGYMGTAAAQAEKTMRGLVEVYGTAYNASGRYVHSVEAQVSMILQNAKATAALAKEQEKAAKVAAKAEAEAAAAIAATRKQQADLEQTLISRNADLRAAAIIREVQDAERAAAARAKAAQEAAAIEQTLGERNAAFRASMAIKEAQDAERAAQARIKSAQEASAIEQTLASRNADFRATALIKEAQAEAAAAKEAAGLAAKYETLRSSVDPMVAVQSRLAQQTRLLDEAMAKGVITAEQHADTLSKVTRAALADVQAIDQLQKGHVSAIGTTNTLRYTTLNLGRQFADIGTQLAGGQSPFLILVQQGPQIADAFATATAGGLTFKAVIAGLVTEAKALLLTFGPWIAGLAAVAGAVWYLVDAHNKQKKAIEDLNAQLTKQRDELSQISPFLFQTGDNANLAAEGQRNFDAWLRKTNVSLAEQNRLLRENALNELNKKALDAAENLRKAQEQFDKVNKPGPRMASAGGAGGFGVVAPVQSTDPKSNPFWKEAKANLDMAKASSEAIGQYLAKMAQAPDTAFASGAGRTAKAIREVKAATDDYLRAAPILEGSLVKAANEVWPEAAAAAEAYKKQQDALKAAANDNIRTFDEQTRGTIRFSSTLEKMAYDLEDAASKSRELRYGVEDIAYAINNNDWTSAFAGMARVLMQVKAAFEQGATSAQKYAAAAAVAGAVGGAIGGTTGATISGAASGAMTGFTLAGPAGAVVGGILGGIGGLLGSSKAKKQRRAQEAAQRAAEEAQRQQTIADTQFGLDIAILRAQGKEQEAVTKERDKEIVRLQALSPALVDSQKQLWALEDAATAAAAAAEKAAEVENRRASIQDQIDKLTLSDSELLAKTRAKERAEAVALDPALGDLIDKLYGLQDSATASEKATAALQAANDAATKAMEAQAAATQFLNDAGSQAIETLTGISKSLREFAGELDGTLGRNSGYDAARAALLTEANSGRVQNLQALGEAFLKASGAKYGNSRDYQRDAAIVRAIALAGANTASERLSGVGAIFGNLPGFATGGSMVVGGNPGVDQNLLSLNGAPLARVGYGETLSVKPRGASNDNSLAELKAEFAAMRAQLADIAASNNKMERTLTNVTEGGRAMQTEAAS